MHLYFGKFEAIKTDKMKKSVAIIGGGPAAMAIAAKLNPEKYNVTIYEKNKKLGRKFLVAGKGGFNLTHSDELEVFVGRYQPNYFLKHAISNFTNKDLQGWLGEMGIETYVGTSKRVFPVKGTKPIDVLDAIESQLRKNRVEVKTNYNWIGFAKDNSLMFESKDGIYNLKADVVVFALGGASWKVTGSDGTWMSYFIDKEITCNPFEASNCAYKAEWPASIIEDIEGKAIKNCKFKCGNSFHLGEAVLTSFGIEGSGVYPLGPEVRWHLANKKLAVIHVDFKPQNTADEIESKIVNRKNSSITKFLEAELKLSGAAVTLIKEYSSKEIFTNPVMLTQLIKNFPINITGLAPLDEAISTVGGISLKEVDEHYQLKKLPNHFILGEMLDWDAPTGGYLLQACFSMGNNLAHYLNRL